MSKAVVTGASGFVGQHVVARLNELGYRVVEASISGPTTVGPVDLREPGSLLKYVDDAELVIHLAARAGGVGFQGEIDPTVFLDNRSMTDTVLRDSTHAGVARVFLASSAVVYRPVRSVVTEVDELVGAQDAPSPYAWSKLTDELVGRWFDASTDTAVVAGRLANVYGPGGDSSDRSGTVVHTLARRALQAEVDGDPTFAVLGHPNTQRSFIHVADAAEAIIVVATQGKGGSVYNIDTGQPTSILDLATLVKDATRCSAQPEFRRGAEKRPSFRVTSPDRLESLGWTPSIDLGTGLVRYVHSLRGSYG